MQAPTNTCKITRVISYRRKSKHPAGFSKMTLADVLWQTVMKHLTLSFTLSRRLVLTGKIISFWQVQICGQHLGWHSSFERFHTTTLVSVQFNPTPPPWYPQTISFMLTYNAPILGALVYLHVYMSKSGDHTAHSVFWSLWEENAVPRGNHKGSGQDWDFHCEFSCCP